MDERNDHPERVESDPAGAEGGAAGSGTANRRLRLASVDREELSGSRIRIRVTLDDGHAEHVSVAEGLDTPIMELRLAAEATLAATGSVLEDADWLDLVGVKLLHAFDADVILIAVRTADQPGRKLVGAVTCRPEGRTQAAVKATLDAVNRVVGARLNDVDARSTT
jgi:hypothetical protein